MVKPFSISDGHSLRCAAAVHFDADQLGAKLMPAGAGGYQADADRSDPARCTKKGIKVGITGPDNRARFRYTTVRFFELSLFLMIWKRVMMIFPPLPVPLIDAVGIVGFALYVLNYTLLTLGGIDGNDKLYFAVNLGAATCVLIGLTASFNLAAALVQIFWVVMSTLGLVIRICRRPASETVQG